MAQTEPKIHRKTGSHVLFMDYLISPKTLFVNQFCIGISLLIWNLHVDPDQAQLDLHIFLEKY